MSAVAPPLGRLLGNCHRLRALGVGGTRLGEIVLTIRRAQVRRLISAGLDAVADTAARKFQGNRLSQSLEHWAGTDSHTAGARSEWIGQSAPDLNVAISLSRLNQELERVIAHAISGAASLAGRSGSAALRTSGGPRRPPCALPAAV